MTGYSLDVLLPILAIYLAAGLVKGALGFGLPVVAVALLPFFVPIETALALNGIVIVLTNLQQIRQGGAYREGFDAAWPMMLGMALMVPVGAVFLTGLETGTLMLILGGFVLTFVITSLLNPALRTPPKIAKPVGFSLGLLSGIVGALTSAPGPIFVMYVVSLHLARPVFVTGLGFIMLLFGGVLTASYIWVGVITSADVVPGLASAPAAVAGMWLGNRWAGHLQGETFRKAVLALLGIIAVLLVRRALT